MANEETPRIKTKHKLKQRHFAARELQITIALLIVIALLGGVFLQSFSSGLSSYLGLSSSFVTIFLVIGYAGLIVFLALLFAYRLVGPFKRLEYEMKVIAKGDIGRRLSVRTKDDLYIRNFVTKVNEFIDEFGEMSQEYNRMSSLISSRLGEIFKKVEDESIDCRQIREDIENLQRRIHEFRERW
ncbi:MAG: HAMP domain-containing protein [Thermodesulfobacteriota bacterium]